MDIRQLERDLRDAKAAHAQVRRALTDISWSSGQRRAPEIIAATEAIRTAEENLNAYVMKARHTLKAVKVQLT